MVDLYKATENKKYLELAGVFVDMRGSQPGGTDQNQTLRRLRDETRAVGHAVTAGYLYGGAADLYMETGEPALLHALEHIWTNMVSSKLYLTGGNAALHHGASMRPELKRHPEDLVSEAFGFEYQLPNASAYNETCATIANAMWNWRMLAITGDAKYTDLMEIVVYNMLSAMSADGTRFTYTNSLRWHGHDHTLLSQDTYSRWRTFFCYCCPTNLARAITWLHEWVYSISEDHIWVHLFAGSELNTTLTDGNQFGLEQKTNYPWDEKVSITIHKSVDRKIALMFRIPEWASDVAIQINGVSQDVSIKPGAYLEINRTWNTGDVVELVIPLKIRLMKTNPKVEETRNQVAVTRGPLVYCLESIDLPGDVSVSEIFLPDGIIFKPHMATDLFGGVIKLIGTAHRIVDEEKQTSLYQEIGTEIQKTIEISLIPYYAWNNRGVSEMSVWMPRK